MIHSNATPKAILAILLLFTSTISPAFAANNNSPNQVHAKAVANSVIVSGGVSYDVVVSVPGGSGGGGVTVEGGTGGV
ncbi:hypothetical protein, partial [Actinomyces qiguomingii]|uniref:hypothetical protein n=1 Tax=Actinomyces qiguomingii TaxID=2057800 RepID=UPI001E4045D9